MIVCDHVRTERRTLMNATISSFSTTPFETFAVSLRFASRVITAHLLQLIEQHFKTAPVIL